MSSKSEEFEQNLKCIGQVGPPLEPTPDNPDNLAVMNDAENGETA